MERVNLLHSSLICVLLSLMVCLALVIYRFIDDGIFFEIFNCIQILKVIENLLICTHIYLTVKLIALTR